MEMDGAIAAVVVAVGAGGAMAGGERTQAVGQGFKVVRT